MPADVVAGALPASIGNRATRAVLRTASETTSTAAGSAAVIRRMPKPTGITDEKLQNIVNALFRDRPAGGAQVGDGSAMAALNHELTNPGARVGGRSHAMKIAETIGALENMKSKHDNPRSPYRLEPADLNIVTDLLAACRKAQRGEYTG